MKIGDPLELLDGKGAVYLAEIEKIEKMKIACRILESRKSIVESRIKITLAQTLPKARKMDFIIEKCTELGVNKIIPMLTERTIVKSAKIDRWRKIAKEAAEQSGRADIPEIASLIPFEEILKMKSQFDLAIIPWELEKEISLKNILTTHGPNNLLVLIGPEGGFSQKEIDLARKAGFISISLGKRILRTETAGMAVLSMLMYEKG
jgi:16S rRNA (uracil1498-N3)-methyltransferase